MSEKSKLLRESEDEKSHKRYGSVSYKYTLIDSVPKTHFTKKQCILVSIALLLVVIAFSVTLIIGLPKLREKRDQYLRGDFPVSDNQEFIFKTGAIVVDGQPCAQIGKDILSKNGSAVDSAIAMLFCDEIANPQSLGIGGGFFMIVYNRSTKMSEVIDARETAPINVDINIFNNNETLLDEGGLSIAVPGQLKGMLFAHRKYGKLNWTALVEPSINLAKNGIIVSNYLEKVLLEVENEILNEPTLNETFVNIETKKLYKSGELLKRPKLAETLEKIAKNGEDFYNGSIAIDLINDVKNLGGILTIDDLKNYAVKSRYAINVSISGGDYTLLTTPPPASGPVVAYILNIMNSFNTTCNSSDTINDRILSFHRFIEAQKFAFAKRSHLADPDFNDNSAVVNEMTSEAFAKSIIQQITDQTQEPSYYGLQSPQIMNEGTGHLAVIAPNGDTVSVSASINSVFGSKRISTSTGIVLNNEMKDFSVAKAGQTPQSVPNSMAGGKRPLSSMSPSIIIDKKGNTKMVIGAIGGTRIVPAITQVLYQTLWKCDSLKEATDASRLFYDMKSDQVLYEAEFPKVYIDGLFHFGHKLMVDQQISGVYSILNTNSTLHTLVDHRKGGSSDGF